MFYPADAQVPSLLSTDEFLFRPLRASDVELDYEAVMTSRETLLLFSGGSWPAEEFTLAENLRDLERHEKEHDQRVAFTYTIMNPGETRCLGCIYLAPFAAMLKRTSGTPEQIATGGDYQAWINFWVRQDRLADNLDQRVLSALLAWLATQWAFQRVVFATRKEHTRQQQLYASAGLHLLFTLPRSVLYTC
jgi:RimJ/RimL family protein N-acetyltransferase